MKLNHHQDLEISSALLEAIRTHPVQREVEHCGVQISVSPFAIYADCPQCGAHVKVRAFSATNEIEDVFDAVFEWINQPDAEQVARERRRAIAEDSDA